MSNINYNVWGQPDTWTHWSASTNPTTETLYGSFRTGAGDWDNSDFTDYPYFKIPNVVNLRNLLVNGNIPLNEPLDNTLAYTAIGNSDLPQCNRYVFNSVHHTINDYIAKADTIPTPFSLGYYYRNDNTVNPPCMLGQFYGFDGFPSNALTIDYGKMQRFSPFASYDTVYTNVNGDYNPILRIAPVTSFGVKSVILEIMVGYIDYDTYMLTGTLKSYLNHTNEWLQAHPIVMAYCMPYFRTNTNGTYTTNISNPSMRFTGVCPVFYTPYRDKSDTYDIYNYLSTFNYRGGSGCFPIFGGVFRDSFSTSVAIAVSRVSDEQMTKTNLSRYAVIYGADKGTLYYTGNDASGYIYCTLDLSIPENVEYIMHGAAAYGMFFCTQIGTLGNSGRDTGATERWLDNDMYCGIIENDGMTYGNYTRGEDNKDNQVYGWKDSTQTPFDPGNIPSTDNTHYDYETKFNHYGLTACSCNQYVVYEDDVVKLADIIATAINTRPDPDQLSTVDYALNNGLTNNPVDTIISVRAYPARSLPITEKLVGGVLTDHEPLHCGAWYNNDVTGYFLGSTYDVISFSFRRGTNNGFVAAFGNSFLDYAPFTRAELIIPYCGTVQLNPADFLEHDINVKIIVDYITGLCTAFIMRENVAVMTVSGSMGIDVPITGLQNATYDSQRLNAVINRENANSNAVGSAVGLFGSTVGLAASVASGNVVGAIASIAGIGASIAKQPTVQNAMEKADYELTHQILPTKVVQSGSPMISYVYENCCRLIVYRPVISEDFDPAVYADTVGFACLINGTVSQFTGLTVGTIDTAGVSCTEKEKEMIQKLFASGVYL